MEYCRYCEGWLVIPDRICVGCGNRRQRLPRPARSLGVTNRRETERQGRSAPAAISAAVGTRYHRKSGGGCASHPRPWELVSIVA